MGRGRGPGENAFFIKNLHRDSSRMWKKDEKAEKKVPKICHLVLRKPPAYPKKSKMRKKPLFFLPFLAKMSKNGPKIVLKGVKLCNSGQIN